MAQLTMQDILNKFYADYREKYTPSAEQLKVINAIRNCRTGSLGLNASVCEDCGSIRIHNNSCRNRCCPNCQQIPTEKWIDARQEDVLDAPYFHVVFTIPEILNPIIYSNQDIMYNLLFRCSSEAVAELTLDSKYLGARPGFISVLHTWGSEMNYHPHIHMILLGGGLDHSGKWKSASSGFFIPVKVLAKVFRGKFMEGLKRLRVSRSLQYHGTSEKYFNSCNFQDMVNECYEIEWNTYIKETFNGAGSVIRYLGKYTHRIAISNRRLVSIDDDKVTYYVKDYRNKGKWKKISVSGSEFIRRFLMHVPPKRFVRIRHYGILATRCKSGKMELCRKLLKQEQRKSRLKGISIPDILKILWDVDICTCEKCGGQMKAFHPSAHMRC